MFENPRRGRQARNFTTNVPKILDPTSSSEQIFFRKLSLGSPESWRARTKKVNTHIQISLFASPPGLAISFLIVIYGKRPYTAAYSFKL